MDDTVIKVEHVSKEYKLGSIGGGTLRNDLQSFFARKKGKTNPNSVIGVTDNADTANKKFMALNDVSFEIKKGEAVGIIGHNGAGKSTLLKLLSRVTVPTEGKISYNGKIASMLEVGTGFHLELTGRENVYMNGAILGMSKSEIRSKFDQIVEFAEMEEFIDTPVKRYSSGMYVKLAFSVAAHLDADIMIMDEVLAVGDMAFQQKCLNKMHEQASEEGRTVLYVSHNMNTVRQLCSRAIVLEKGTLIYDGNVEDGIAAYLGGDSNDISMNLNNLPRINSNADKVELIYAEFVGKETNLFEDTDFIKVRMQFRCKKDTDNLFFRITVFDKSGNAVGSGITEEPFSAIGGETAEKIVELDVSSLIDGSYNTDFAVFEKGDDGITKDADHVNGLAFKLKSQYHDVMWSRKNWGNMKLRLLERN